MQRISEFFGRLAGPILLVTAFSVFVSMQSAMMNYIDLVRGVMIDDDVYSEGSVDGENQIFLYDSSGHAVVKGSYVLSMLLAGTTVTTEVVDGSNPDYRFRIVFETRLGTEVYYIMYNTTLLTESIVESGVYHAGENFPFHGYIDMTAQYGIERRQGVSGALDRLVFTRK